MNEKLKELFDIMQDNPDLQVEFLVDGEYVSQDYKYSKMEIQKSELSDWIETEDDPVYTDYNKYIEYLVEFEQRYDSYEEARYAHPKDKMQKRICVYLGW